MRTKTAACVSSVFVRPIPSAPSGRWVGGGLALLLLGACAGRALPASVAPSEVTAAGTQAESTSSLVPVRTSDPRWGDELAPVTVVAFLDFECPYCAQVHPTLSALLARYGPEQIRLVLKHAPLPFHQRGIPAARAAQAVYETGGSEVLLQYMARLFDNPEDLSDVSLRTWAEEVGVTAEAFDQRVNDPAVAAKVQSDIELATQLRVDGVPAFLVNGAPIVGARPIEDFETLIEHELRATGELRRRGVAPGDLYASRVQVNFDGAEADGASSQGNAFEDIAYQVPIGTSPTRGPKDAPVTIVEFADFECAYCRHAHQTMQELFERYPGKIQWVMKHTPLAFHPAAVPAALTALEARRQKGERVYWEALDRIYALEQLSPDALLTLAEDLELDAKGLLAALDSPAPHPQLEADQALAMDLEARGTPHFFINGRRMAGAQPREVFEQIVNQELKKVNGLALEQGGSGSVYEVLQQSARVPPGLVRHDVPAPDATAPVWGEQNAPVTIQMFADMECGFCRKALPTLAALKQKYPGKIQVVWRHLPLPFHKQARQAAAAALEAQAQLGDEGFWAMSARLLGMSPELFQASASPPRAQASGQPSDLSVDSLTKHAEALGLDMQRFQNAMNEGRHLAVIDRDQDLARGLGVSGTPAFFINGYALSGAQPLHRFERLVRLALKSQPTADNHSGGR